MPVLGAMLKIYDGSISKSFWIAFGYKCTRFYACTTKCTIPLYVEALLADLSVFLNFKGLVPPSIFAVFPQFYLGINHLAHTPFYQLFILFFCT